MKIRTQSLDDIKKIRKKEDGYYVPIYSQGGGAKLFWSYAGKKHEDAVNMIKNQQKPTIGGILPAKQKKALLKTLNAHRSAESAEFNKSCKMAFYTDYPWRFSGENSVNPTAQLFDTIGLKYDFVDSKDIIAGKLDEFTVLFCPGGFGYFPLPEVTEQIKAFVKKGGGFFGFCSGAFLPLKTGIGLCKSTFAYLREQGYPNVLLNPDDPIAQGIESTRRKATYALFPKPSFLQPCTVTMRMLRCNGPLIIPQGKDKAAGYFDSTEKYSPIVRATYGKGRVVAVSTHPDCDPVKMVENTSFENLIANYKLSKNIILYCSRIDKK
jgi:hypothetical protein